MKSKEILRDAKTGNIIDTVARFEVISVKKLTEKTIINIIKIRLILFKPNKFSPIHKVRPLPCIAAANDKPPPKSKIISQGIL